MIDQAKILESKLQREPSLSGGAWSVWEHKTWNVHRGVLCWTPEATEIGADELAAAVRQKVEQSFRRSWWRGLGFGVLTELAAAPDRFKTIDQHIDAMQNSKGTWQWSILAFPEVKAAIGVHTWTAGYLSTVFTDLLEAYKAHGFRSRSFKKEPGKLLQFLLAASESKFRPEEFDPGND